MLLADKRPNPRPWPVVAFLLAIAAFFAAVVLAPLPAYADPPPHPASSGSAAPAASGSAKAPEPGASVKIHDRKIWTIQVPRAGRSPQERAAAASQVLELALEEADAVVKVEPEGDVHVVYAGKRPIIQLSMEDATAAGDATLGVHADAFAAKARDALKAERQRSAIATTVFSFSLVVFSALVAFLLLRKIGELIDRGRKWMEEHPDKLPVLHVRGIEVVQPAAVRGGLSVALSGAKLFAQIGTGYAWILIALSLFEATRGYTEVLTGFVVSPISKLMGRVASALPVLVIAMITVAVVGVALRFVRLFFGSIARGETTVGWVPKELATPTSFLVRAGIVITSLVVAAPLITGSDNDALARAGVVALVALGLASTPILASAAAGIAVVFGRRIEIGDHTVIGNRTGRVVATTMLEVLLEDEDGCQVHVPHLLSLLHPTRVLGRAPPIVAEVAVSPSAPLARAVDLIIQAASRVGARPRVDILAIDADGARVRVAVYTSTTDGKNKLLCTISEIMSENGIALGRGPAGAKAA